MSDDIKTLREYLNFAQRDRNQAVTAYYALERVKTRLSELQTVAVQAQEMAKEQMDACIAAERERDDWKSRAQQFQRERAELSDALNGTPCAEIRWQYERDSLRAKLERAKEEIEQLRERQK